jgi:hypothetical protein
MSSERVKKKKRGHDVKQAPGTMHVSTLRGTGVGAVAAKLSFRLMSWHQNPLLVPCGRFVLKARRTKVVDLRLRRQG